MTAVLGRRKDLAGEKVWILGPLKTHGAEKAEEEEWRVGGGRVDLPGLAMSTTRTTYLPGYAIS